MSSSVHWSSPEASEPPRPDAPADRGTHKHPNGPNSHSRPNLQSCQFCRKRKIRCDKLEGGCSQCLRAQTECVYPASQRKGRPRKPGSSRPNPALTPRESQLLKKIWKLERTINTLTGKSETDGADGDIDSLGQIDADEAPHEQLGRLVIGKPYVNDTFWSNQLMDVLDDSDDDSNDEDDDSLAAANLSDVYPAGFLVAADQAHVSLSALHPPPAQIKLYWKLHVERCERLMRILHAPSTSEIVDQAVMDPKSLSRSNELLMFAIYFSTLTSLTDEEVLEFFGVDRMALILRYETAVQRALVNASFLNSQDLKALQAFLLYLICTPHTESAAVWSMVGLAIRIAQGMGIDRDGELFKLSPLDVELRRRIWHQLSLLDLRASEARGAYPMHLSYDTKLPLNINDSDIGPDTQRGPATREGLTDMTIALMRLEVCDITRRLHRTVSFSAKEKLVEDFQIHIEAKYIQDCIDDVDPLHRLCGKLGRLVTKRMILMLFRRELDLPQKTREKLFYISIDIIDLSNQLRKDEYAGRWSWLVKTYMQWHAMAVVLSELSEQPRTPETERAWKVIEETGPEWEVPEDRANRILYQSVKKLLSKARAHRAAQGIPAQVQIKSIEGEKDVQGEPIYTTQGSFDAAYMRNPFHAPSNYSTTPEHSIQQFYVPQHLSMDEMAHQEQVQPWFFDPNVQPLQDQDLVFNAEYWSGWDPVKDYSLHGGTM